MGGVGGRAFGWRCIGHCGIDSHFLGYLSPIQQQTASTSLKTNQFQFIQIKKIRVVPEEHHGIHM